jgi:sugar lactone lactonase YvrE
MFRVGSGSLQYELVEGWEQLPKGWEHPDVAAVATDSQGRVYVFARCEHPVIVYDRDGHFLDSWGHDLFGHAHGIYIDADDYLYLVDDFDHTCWKCTTDGKVLLKLGTSGQASDTGYTGTSESIQRGGPPFHRPTNMVLGSNGSLYVSDGYGNARVHRFSGQGELLRSWGGPGTGHGEFMLPHGVWAHPDGRVFVADRENDRIQIFAANGDFLESWDGLQRPADIYMDKDGRIYVGELAVRENQAGWERERFYHQVLPARVSIFDADRNLLHRWGGAPAEEAGNFVSPHDIWVDDEGSIYVGEVTHTSAVRFGLVPPGTHTLQKFARI